MATLAIKKDRAASAAEALTSQLASWPDSIEQPAQSNHASQHATIGLGYVVGLDGAVSHAQRGLSASLADFLSAAVVRNKR